MPVLTKSSDTTVGLPVVYALHAGDHDYFYVGLTTRGLHERLSGHRKRSRQNVNPRSVHAHIRVVGASNTQIELLSVASSHEELGSLESAYVDELKFFGYRLFNLNCGGYGNLGYTHTEATRAKISNTQAGRPKSDETRARMSLARSGEGATWFGKTLSDEHKSRISDAVTGESNPFYGKTHDEKTRALISATKKANPNDVNHRRWHVARGLTNPDCKFCV